MDRETIDQLWQTALRQSIEDGEQFTRYHFAKLVAEHVIKSAPDYKIGYADGVAVEREACAKVCEALVPDMSRTANDASVWDVATLDCAAAIRARSK